jgi:hypothetical protein
MIDQDFPVDSYNDEQLINRLKRLASIYWKYYNLKGYEYLYPDTASVLYQAARRLEDFTFSSTDKLCENYRYNMYGDNIARCFGTKEIDPCNCKGNKNKRDFYNKGEN